MKLNDKVTEALLETVGTRKSVIALLDSAVSAAEASLLCTPPDAAQLLEARLKLEGARMARAHVAKLMAPGDR